MTGEGESDRRRGGKVEGIGGVSEQTKGRRSRRTFDVDVHDPAILVEKIIEFSFSGVQGEISYIDDCVLSLQVATPVHNTNN